MKKNFVIGALLIILAAIGLYQFTNNNSVDVENEIEDTTPEVMTEEPEVMEDPSETVLGQSVGGRDITAYHYGSGEKELLFVGGTHGGYSWNTALVAYDLVNHLDDNPDFVPENVKVTVIPVLNPDGLQEIVGTTDDFAVADVDTSLEDSIEGRFNGNGVDLNRNFDCDWESVGTWQNREVDGGSSVFSEPESIALKNYVESNEIAGAVVWYSSAGGVFASSCHNGILSETRDLTNSYADASGYGAYEEFDFYEITGDMVNWLAKKEIPAISVLLSSHSSVEWSDNLKGITALIEYYAE